MAPKKKPAEPSPPQPDPKEAVDDEGPDEETLEAATEMFTEILNKGYDIAREKEVSAMDGPFLVGSIMHQLDSVMNLCYIEADPGEDVSSSRWTPTPEPEPAPPDGWSRGVLHVQPPAQPVMKMPRRGAKPPPLPVLPESATAYPSRSPNRAARRQSRDSSSPQRSSTSGGTTANARPMSAAVTRGGAQDVGAGPSSSPVSAAGAVRPSSAAAINRSRSAGAAGLLDDSAAAAGVVSATAVSSSSSPAGAGGAGGVRAGLTGPNGQVLGAAYSAAPGACGVGAAGSDVPPLNLTRANLKSSQSTPAIVGSGRAGASGLAAANAAGGKSAAGPPPVLATSESAASLRGGGMQGGGMQGGGGSSSVGGKEGAKAKELPTHTNQGYLIVRRAVERGPFPPPRPKVKDYKPDPFGHDEHGAKAALVARKLRREEAEGRQALLELEKSMGMDEKTGKGCKDFYYTPHGDPIVITRPVPEKLEPLVAEPRKRLQDVPKLQPSQSEGTLHPQRGGAGSQQRPKSAASKPGAAAGRPASAAGSRDGRTGRGGKAEPAAAEEDVPLWYVQASSIRERAKYEPRPGQQPTLEESGLVLSEGVRFLTPLDLMGRETDASTPGEAGLGKGPRQFSDLPEALR